MASKPDVDEVLDFLSEWKTSKELKSKYGLSNTQAYNYLNWLRPHFILKVEGVGLQSKNNRTYIYKSKESISEDVGEDKTFFL